MASKHLALLRHAKSSWEDASLDDHDRPLAPRGRRAAARIGEYMRQNRIRPDLVLCSSATRTRQTLELLDLAGTPDVLIEDELYGAPAARLIDRLRQVDDLIGSVLLIAHNPGVQDAATGLAADPADIGDAYPTAALANFRVSIPSWGDLRLGIADVTAFVVPKQLS